jgi:hypothetical protein
MADSMRPARIGAHTVVFVLPSPAPLGDAFARRCRTRLLRDSIDDVAFQRKQVTLKEPAARAEAENEYVLGAVQRGDANRESDHLFFGSYAIATVPTNEEGEFSAVLPAGTYTLLAVMPLHERTYEWFLPVSVGTGQTARHALNEANNYTRGWSCETALPFAAIAK